MMPLLISQVTSGSVVQGMGMGVVAAMVFGLAGIGLLLLGYFLFDLVTPRIDVQKELCEKEHGRGGRGGGPAVGHRLRRRPRRAMRRTFLARPAVGCKREKADILTPESAFLIKTLRPNILNREDRPVNRLTKQISLVLISSSLILHGCYEPEKKEDDPENPQPAPAGAGAGTSNAAHHHHPGGWFFGWPSRGSYGSSVGSSRSGSSGFHGSSISGGSSRGGFGASAHGVSS